MAARLDSLKDEMDEALNKVEMCKVGSVYPHPSQALFIRLGSDLDILFLGEERGLCTLGTLLGNLQVKVRAPSGVHLSLHETILCVTTLFYHLCTCIYLIYISIYLFNPAGPALCRHVQLCLKRGQLCTLLRHGEHIYSERLKKKRQNFKFVTRFGSIIC